MDFCFFSDAKICFFGLNSYLVRIKLLRNHEKPVYRLIRLHVSDPADAGAAACRGENGRGGAARRYAPHGLLHRHTCHAGQRAGFALPDRRRGGERFGRRSGHLRRRPDEHGERPRAGACARTHVAAPQAVVHGAGQPRNDVVRKRLHGIPPSVRTCGMRRHPRQGLSLSGLCQRALYENGRRKTSHGSNAKRPPHGPASGS